MTHVWFLLWPKLIPTSATECDGGTANSAASKPSTTSTTTYSSSSSSSSTHCHGSIKRLVRKLKKHSRILMRRRAAASRPSSGCSCKYDPLSYSLNFDSSGWGSFLDGEYYQFHAFSSRFIMAKANPNQQHLHSLQAPTLQQ